MRRHIIPITICLALAAGFSVAQTKKGKKKEYPKKELYSGEPIKALIVTGGCCHNYLFQTFAMGSGIQKLANVDFEVVNVGGKGTEAKIPLYDDPDWAKPYDVVIHNECFANTTDPEYIRRITEAHRGGVPAVVIHCAMHSYRAAEIDDWREFLGVTSRKHEHQSEYPVKLVAPDHPVMAGFPKDWVTPKDELYLIERVWPNTTILASAVSEVDNSEQPVIWASYFGGTKIVGTTFGHTDETFEDPVFIRMLANALLWASGTEAAAAASE